MIEYFLIFLVVIRVFTESMKFLPRFFNFIDGIFVFVIFGLALLIYKKNSNKAPHSIILLAIAFASLFAVSVIGNIDRVKIIPTAVFLILYFQPIVWYFSVVKAGTDFKRLMPIVLVLFFLQAFIGFFFQVPKAMATGNADLVSGTFGTNNSQMFFFIGIVIAFIVAEMNQGSVSLRKVFTLAVGSLLAIFASFRAGLIIFVVCLLAMIEWKRKAVAYLLILGVLTGAAFTMFASLDKFTKYGKIAESLEGIERNLFILPKARMILEYPQVVSERPSMLLIGLGPATFMSRAYVQFINVPTRKDMPNVDVTRGSVNRTAPDYLSKKYFVNLNYLSLFASNFSVSSATAIGPQSSYYSIIYELGIPALIVYLLLYWKMWGIMRFVRKNSTDRLMRSFVFSAQVSTLFLLFLAIFDDWFSITRSTTLLWTMLAIISLEYNRLTSLKIETNELEKHD